MKSMIKFISNQEAHIADEDFDENILFDFSVFQR